MISFCWMQHPTVGYRVKPNTDTATGTSSLHGNAADATTQQDWHWALMTLQPSHSGRIPKQAHGNKHGASGLQQHCKFMQQIPAYKCTNRFNKS
jgi:hypothetical protein